MTHELRLSHGLYNAGLLGFIRIMEKAGKTHYLAYDQAGDSLKLDIKALEGFEKDYYNYFNSVYGEGTTTYKMIAGYKTLVAGSETFEEAFKDWEKSTFLYSLKKRVLMSLPMKLLSQQKMTTLTQFQKSK